ncbi:ATP-binding cassette domain-containing protein [Glutamicibacter sp. NPDC087344]|uniref:ATP-binding cassette domain-containing protein n=1 Tax=Glutamicibacter sp. NPDC087344 TaxID=3363994 RepID=UPI0037F187F6
MKSNQGTVTLSLELKSFRYDGVRDSSLQEISLWLAPGELVTVTGPSGSGKSTLGMVLAGMLPRRGMDRLIGTVSVGSQQVEFTTESQPEIDLARWAQHVALLPQDARHYLSGIRETVREELVFSLENQGLARELMHDRVQETSAEFSIGHLLDSAPENLSGGQQRLVALAALAITNPDVMVLDEPFAGLDVHVKQRVHSLIGRLRAKGTGIVILSDRVDQESSDDVVYLSRADASQTHSRSLLTLAERAPHTPTEQINLELRDVSLGYDTAFAANFNLTLHAGECVGITGPNGTGKSTLLKTVAGLIKPLAGQLSVVNPGLLLQNSSDQLFERTVLREVSFGLSRAERGAVAEVLDVLRLSHLSDSHPYELSASGRRLLALATVVVRKPAVLLLDEPTEGLDHEGRLRLQEIIDFTLEQGSSVLLTSHDEEFIKHETHRTLAVQNERD